MGGAWIRKKLNLSFMNKKIAKLTTFFVLSTILSSPATALPSSPIESALVDYKEGKYIEAISKLETFLNLTEDPLDKAIALSNLAANYYQLGQNKEAIFAWSKSIELLKTLPNSKDYLLKTNLSLSQVYINLGDAEQAIPRLLNVTKITDEQEFLQLAWGLLGSAYYSLGKNSKAIEFYEKSLEIQPLTITLINLSLAYVRRSEQLKIEGMRLREEANNSEANKLESLAIVDWQKATGFAQTAIEVAANEGTREKIKANVNYLKFVTGAQQKKYTNSTIRLLEFYPNSTFKAISLIKLAQFHSSQSLSLLEQAIEVSQKIDARLTLSTAYLELASTYEKDGKYNKALALNTKGLLAAESVVGSVSASENLFRLFQQRGRIQQSQGKTSDAISSYSQALWNLRLNRGAISIGNNQLLFALREEVKPFLKEYIELLLSSKTSREKTKKALEILSVLKLSEFQIYFNDPCFEVIAPTTSRASTSKNPHTATIYSLVLPERTYLILRLPGDSYQIFNVNISQVKLRQKVVELRAAISDRQKFDYVSKSTEFYQLLFGQIEKYLKANQIKNLAFIHDGILRNIPMEVLLNSQKQFLIERYKILYLTGLSGSLPKTQRKRNNIFFGISEAREGLGALPNVVKEAESVKESLEAKVYLDSQFTYKNFENLLNNGNYSTIHIATHGKFSGTAKNSWLLSYDRQIILDALKNALLSTKSPPELLIFSACETAKGSQSATLGFAGVGLRARTKNVIGSLWPIPDLGTAELMELFYQELKNGTNLIDAKREAQLKMIQQKQDPASWAGLILIENQP